MQPSARRLSTGAGRFARGLTMSAACFVMPVAAHAAAGGGVPIHAGFILAILLLSVACVAMADRRRHASEITALLMASQPVFHVLLAMGGHHRGINLVPDLGMLLAHIVVALMLGLLLSGVETAIWSLATLSATVLLTPVRRLLSHSRPDRSVHSPRVQPHSYVLPLFSHQIVTSISYRGPPAFG